MWRRKNKITYLKDAMGNWVEDEKKLKVIIFYYFKSPYEMEEDGPDMINTTINFPELIMRCLKVCIMFLQKRRLNKQSWRWVLIKLQVLIDFPLFSTKQIGIKWED